MQTLCHAGAAGFNARTAFEQAIHLRYAFPGWCTRDHMSTRGLLKSDPTLVTHLGDKYYTIAALGLPEMPRQAKAAATIAGEGGGSQTEGLGRDSQRGSAGSQPEAAAAAGGGEGS